ncbi:syndecan isoform X1 [Amyelois transitella]|uniref:syndecan isoform X1 n=1 Tax=Amyelois transitella TaxID=680683 RepID=UPI00067C5C46|nr:syndecan isoform X1 [Amyelois transitella]
MHLRIYLWLSCVVLAGYVRATEDSAAAASNQAPPDYVDDDGSGLEGDESSGSGWGAGPGVDDEDGRGSGDGPEDDEDYTFGDYTTASSIPISDLPNTTTVPEFFAPVLPESTPAIPADFDVVIPRLKPAETSNPEVVIGGARDTQPSRPDQTDISISGEETNPEPDHQPDGSSFVESKVGPADTGVLIMNKPEDQATSFFAQPGILAAVIGGAVVGLLCAILVVMFIVYRMRKKDEGSYALDEPKRSPAAASYGKGHNNREFYA